MANSRVKDRPATNQAKFQYTREGVSMQQFVDDIIREYGKPDGDTFYICASTLPKHIQKIFLTYLIDPETLEALLHDVRAQTLINECLDDMQSCLDERVDEVYRQAQEEMGLYLRHDPINGEIIYPRY